MRVLYSYPFIFFADERPVWRRKDPYDPEEGIIDLFDIVDDPEASPEPEPRGALHDDGGQALPGQPEAADPETPPGEESERVVSRYPFENSDDFLEEIEKTPLMTLLPPKGEATALPEEPVSDGAEEEAPAESLGEPVREEPDEASIRAFEAEMAKAGAVVHEYDVKTAPGMADASGVPDETEAPALSTGAVDQDVRRDAPRSIRNPPSRNPLKDRMPRIWNCCSATLRLRMPHRLSPRRLRRSPLWKLHAGFPRRGGGLESRTRPFPTGRGRAGRGC